MLPSQHPQQTARQLLLALLLLVASLAQVWPASLALQA
jgi:hypothetical protein